jgi:glycosyltransferase involved in cell wall biosynthesis
MPAYNVEAYIEEAILSIVGQDYRNLELVVVNDGSSDGTRKIVEKLARRYPAIAKCLTISNSGPARARNVGIQNARGRIIAYQDADDISFAGRISREVRYLMENPHVAMVYGGMEVRYPGGAIERQQTQSFNGKLLLLRNYIPCGSVMHRRSILDRVGWWNDNDDWDLWIRVSERYAIGNVPEVVYQYRVHDSEFRHSRNVLRNALIHLRTFEKRYERKKEVFVGMKVVLLFVQYKILKCLQTLTGNLTDRPRLVKLIAKCFQFAEYKAFRLFATGEVFPPS